MKLDIDYAIGILAAIEDDDVAIVDPRVTLSKITTQNRPNMDTTCRMLQEAGLIEAWEKKLW